MKGLYVCLLAIAVLAVAIFSPAAAGGLLLLGMAGPSIRDLSLYRTKALPAGASAVNSDGFDLGQSTGEFLASCELLLTAPALAVGQLANGSTMTYAVYHDTAVGFGTETLLATILTQTGAGGAGAAAATARYRFPTNVKRYVRVKATNSAAADASGASLTAELLF